MRLQILELPTKYVGEASETPFVIVASEVKPVASTEHSEQVKAEYGRMREMPGCEHVFVTDDVVEIGPA